MPIIGVICPFDNSPQSFGHCIDCHIHRSKTRNCNVPVQALKSARDNHIDRKGAGISASTLISCPRAIYLEQNYDLYEPVISIYNKFRGTVTHSLMESERDPPPWIIRERRLYRDINGQRVTGKPDDVDTKYLVLTDYKSKDNLPKNPDPAHEFQFNCYAWLLRGGYWMDNHEKADIDIQTIGAHYVTNKTNYEKAFKKMVYPVWSDERTTEVIAERLEALINYFTYDIIPPCDPYVKNPRWTCQCEKWIEQLTERGIDVKL